VSNAKVHKRRPERITLKASGRMPNSDLPVMLYRKALTGDGKESRFYDLFRTNHWGGCWSAGIYGYHHFHSNAHEALGIAAGSAEIILGGDGGLQLSLQAGDLIVLPAGTGHRRIKDSWDFWVVGAYPHGQEKFDEYLDRAMCANCAARLRAVQLPEADPLYGKTGPLIRAWARERSA
jgi:uncharacterized protein YjlB